MSLYNSSYNVSRQQEANVKMNGFERILRNVHWRLEPIRCKCTEE